MRRRSVPGARCVLVGIQMADGAINVLFVCEGNSVRSVMAQALLTRFGDARFHAFSAGLRPDGEVHPMTIETLKGSGLSVAGIEPKHVQEFLNPAAPSMDIVISMSEGATATLANWPGHPLTAYWRITDPISESSGDPGQKFAFHRAFRELENRIRLLVLVNQHKRRDVPAEPRQLHSA